jgi:hypothetical protein
MMSNSILGTRKRDSKALGDAELLNPAFGGLQFLPWTAFSLSNSGVDTAPSRALLEDANLAITSYINGGHNL